ncbi:hypothetical protein DFJ74DRAFT_649004 [Hyaloraphidium curvatum]|nr:hypothetical protein DFJ74DRAFT_649004 [Hyaloraphidium curvatum]
MRRSAAHGSQPSSVQRANGASPAPSPAPSAPNAATTTQHCVCCDTALRFPAEVPAFRCVVCDTICDLNPTSAPKNPQPLTLEKVRLYATAVSNKTCEPPVFRTMLANAFGSSYNLNRSFPKGNVGLQNPGVDMADVREAYRIVGRMAPDFTEAITEGMEKTLRRPGRRLAEAQDVRFLLVLLDYPLFVKQSAEQAHRYHQLLSRLLGLMSTLSNDLHRHLVSWFTLDPEDVFHRRVDMINYFLTFRLTRVEGMRERYPTDWCVKAAARVMALLFAANGMRTRGRLPTAVFYNSVIDYLDFQKDFQRWQEERGLFSFCQYPFLISLGSKMLILEFDAKRTMGECGLCSLRQIRLMSSAAEKFREAFVISALHGLPTDPFLSLHVRRNHLVEDSLNQLSKLRAVDLKKRLRIEFVNEDGVDAGGLTKEWFLLLVRQLLDPNYGLFVYDEDSRLAWFNSWSFETTAEYHLIGMVIGLAIYQSTILDIPFPPALYKKLLGHPPTFEDFTILHPALGRGLQQMLAFDGSVQDVFCREFVVEVEYFGKTERVPLKDGGERIPVTNQNRQEYVNLLVDWTFNKQAAKQFEAFKSGFDTVCRGSPLTLLKPDELELLVRGDPEIDFKGLEAVAEYEGFTKEEPVIRWLWETVASYPPESQRKFLMFFTGSDRVIPTGSHTMQVKVSCAGVLLSFPPRLSSFLCALPVGPDSERLPVAHTCFNQILLYRYSSKHKLDQKLRMAINESSGFALK